MKKYVIELNKEEAWIVFQSLGVQIVKLRGFLARKNITSKERNEQKEYLKKVNSVYGFFAKELKDAG